MLAWANAISTVVMALFTGILVRITRQQKVLTDIALRATHVIDRAYVTISHREAAPGYNPGLMEIAPGTITISVEIRNQGHTPARVLGGILAVETGPNGATAPTEIPTGPYKTITPAFLMPGAAVYGRYVLASQDPAVLGRAMVYHPDVDPPPPQMWIVGFVCYRDSFGDERSGGYGRHFDRALNDLVFDWTTPHLNYDRALTERERRLGLQPTVAAMEKNKSEP